jgi:hypothetical protein
MKTTIKLLAILALAVVLISPGASAYAQPRARPKFPERMKNQVKYLSGEAMLLRAKRMGIKKIFGKDISGRGRSAAQHGHSRVDDIPIGANPAIEENEPAAAASPVNRKNLVAGSHYIPNNPCVAYTSSDGGINWTAPVAMPQLTGASFCSDPVLAYAPDGSRVYYAYMDIKSTVDFIGTTVTFYDDWDIVVSYSDDDGKTWTGPIVALDGDPSTITFDDSTGELLEFEPGFQYDKPWISAPLDSAQKDWAYVTATRFDSSETSDCHIAFTRSGDKSATWGAPALLESSSGCNPVVQGSRPAGGKSGNVLIAWYNSGPDGWLTGSFQIRTRLSSNNGATWNNIVTAATDSYELPFWLGPEAFYHRWWGGMFPDVDVDGQGAAHIAYTHDPAENPTPGFSDTAEDGDIRYVTSSGAPYNNWSAPVTVNDDGMVRAQGWATLETQTNNSAVNVYLIWEDHRLSPEVPTAFPNSPNLYYDIFSSKKGPGGPGWFANQRVSDASSIVDYIFIGDYFDLASNSTLIYGVWTDRRDKTSIFDFEDDVFGSWRLLPEAP